MVMYNASSIRQPLCISSRHSSYVIKFGNIKRRMKESDSKFLLKFEKIPKFFKVLILTNLNYY